MAKKQIWVNVREARLLDQAIAKNNFRYLTLDEHKMVDKAYAAMKDSELYNAVGDKVEAEALRLVETNCKPEWERISKEMRTLWERANALNEQKAAQKDWTEELETELNDLNKNIAELTGEYNTITDKANAELNEFKEKTIAETEWAAFVLDADVYNFVGGLVGRVLPTKEK